MVLPASLSAATAELATWSAGFDSLNAKNSFDSPRSNAVRIVEPRQAGTKYSSAGYTR